MYIINKNDRIDEEFITNLNEILDLISQIQIYLDCESKTVFELYSITYNEVKKFTDKVKLRLNSLYMRYVDLGYANTHHNEIDSLFKTCYDKIALIA